MGNLAGNSLKGMLNFVIIEYLDDILPNYIVLSGHT